MIQLRDFELTAREIAAARNGQKRGFASSRYWHEDPHYIGLLGEFVFAQTLALTVDTGLKIEGDDGTDFLGLIDVKTSTFWRDPYLKHPTAQPLTAACYALVVLNLKEHTGWVGGVISRARLAAAAIQDWGHGPQLSVVHTQLTAITDSGFQDWFLSKVRPPATI